MGLKFLPLSCLHTCSEKMKNREKAMGGGSRVDSPTTSLESLSALTAFSVDVRSMRYICVRLICKAGADQVFDCSHNTEQQ